MKSKEELLQLRKKIKSKKPRFLRQDYHKKKRLTKKVWRWPAGRHSKMRLRKRGKPAIVSPGWGSPKTVRGLVKGLKPIIVNNLKQIDSLDKNKEGAIISAGKKKKLALIKKCLEKGIIILNIKNPEEYIKNIEAEMIEQKKKKELKKEKKEEKEEKEKKEKEEKEKKEEIEREEAREKPLEKTLEERKEEERKLQEKILIKPQ